MGQQETSVRKPKRHKTPTLIYVDPVDWVKFQALCGKRGVSARLREMVKRELSAQ